LNADVPDRWDCKAGTTKIAKYGIQGNWMAILILFQKEGKNFNNINFATAISKLAKIRSLKKQDTLFLQLLEATVANLQDPDINPRCYANVAHGLAKLHLRDNDVTGRVFNRLADATVVKKFVGSGKPQEIANTAWACAKLGHSCPELFTELGTKTRSKWLVDNGNAQDIANTAWACATLGHSCSELFAVIGTKTRSDWLVDNGNAQEISMTAWACATLGFYAPSSLPR
jgi:hypothetical protein